MIVVIDTSSLLALERYYLPFDKEQILFEIIKTKIANKEIMVIDKIMKECSNVSKGAILEALSFLKDKEFQKNHKFIFNTEFILPPAPKKFYNMVDNNFVIPIQKTIVQCSIREPEK